MTNFKHYPKRPKRLTAAFAKSEYAKLLARLPAAEAAKTSGKWLELFADWNALKSYIGSEGARIDYVFSQDMRNIRAETADKYFREKVLPVVDQPEHALTQAFLASKHRPALAKRYGQQLVPVFETQVKPLDPINTELSVKAGRLVKKYEKIVSSATVKVDGQTVTLIKAGSFLTSPSAALRKQAFLKTRGWVLRNREELSGIYSQLVELRDQMGKNVGYKNYTPLAYQIMGRTDYGVNQVEKFRRDVLEYVVPVRKKLIAKQAKALGVKTLRPWDGYDPDSTLPIGIAPIDKQLDNARKLFKELSPRLNKHYEHMLGESLIDLENREGKRADAYCTHFSDEASIAILCNSTGDSRDVATLVHEMGHAFQGWESQYIESVDLQWGTADLCEIHSMGMEFLSLPGISIFFDEDNAKKFRFGRFAEAVTILCYICVVDEFQHWVYQNPEAAAVDRDDKWCSLCDIYLPGINYGGCEIYKKTRWYLQMHIFSSPFYYIDYALAETGAMQLALLDSQNHQKALDTYLKLCRLGGTKSILKAFSAAGLRSPFDKSLIKELMAYAAEILEI